jgi:Zn-dependent protease
MPVFLPGFGAYVKWQALGVSAETRAFISLAGPLAGTLAAVACVGIYWQTGNELWAALGRTTAWLNLFNLIPVWMLDGASAVQALAKSERIILLIATLLLWLATGEGMFFLVGLGFGYAIFFDKAQPETRSVKTLVYYIAVMAMIAVLLWYLPHPALQGVGRQ